MRLLFLIVALVSAAGCGYIGDPLPPALNIPQRIADLTVTQVGENLEIEFTLPSLTTEGIVLQKVAGVDLRAGVAGPAPFDTARWAEGAKVINTSEETPGRVKKTLPAKDWAGQEIVIAVRALNASGRTSGWSNLVTVTAVAPLAKPVLRAESDSAGVKLLWNVPSPSAKVFRKGPGDKEPVPMGEAQNAAEYVDRGAEYGKAYEYTITAWNGAARSETSDPVTITPVDTFAPPAPGGLQAIAGVNTIELAWERVADVTDLRGYRVYRSVDGGPFERLTERAEVPSFSDKSAPAGKKCTYAVTAFDTAGNESGKSAVVEVEVP